MAYFVIKRTRQVGVHTDGKPIVKIDYWDGQKFDSREAHGYSTSFRATRVLTRLIRNSEAFESECKIEYLD